MSPDIAMPTLLTYWVKDFGATAVLEAFYDLCMTEAATAWVAGQIAEEAHWLIIARAVRDAERTAPCTP